MTFVNHVQAARQLADSIDDWNSASFTWAKGYVAAVMASLAYEEIPAFELKRTKRAKVIPCERYQSHVADWKETRQIASLGAVDIDAALAVTVRARVVVAIVKLSRVTFVALRGTTISFADVKADFDARKVRYVLGSGDNVKLHRGFAEAVLECFDEVVERLREPGVLPVAPVWIAGHSLGGAMAAIFHARMHDLAVRPPFWRQPTPASTGAFAFGSPRYGNLAAKAHLPPPHHVFNEGDGIPTVPPTLMGYADILGERCLNAAPRVVEVIRKGNFFMRAGWSARRLLGLADHSMERYVDRMAAMHAREA